MGGQAPGGRHSALGSAVQVDVVGRTTSSYRASNSFRGKSRQQSTQPPVDALTWRLDDFSLYIFGNSLDQKILKLKGQSRRTWMMSKRDIDTDRRQIGAVLIAILILILICQVEASTSKIETEYLGEN